jgi:hypothetical protein
LGGMTSKAGKWCKYSHSELRKLAHQYTNSLLIEPRLLKRIPYPKIKGKARVLIHLIKILLGTLRYGTNQDFLSVYDAKAVCFTASSNQLLNFRKVMKDNDNIPIIHFPGAKAQSEKKPLMVLDAKSFIKYCHFLWFRIFVNRSTIGKILNENPHCFDYICDIFFVEFFLNKTEISATTVYICTDLSAFGNMIGKYFLAREIDVVFVPHSPLLRTNNPVYYNFVICRSEAEVQERRDWLLQCGVSDVGFFLRQKKIQKGDGIGLLIKPEDTVSELTEIIKELNCTIFLRPHPMMSNTKDWQELATQLDFSFSDPLLETSDEFLSNVGIVVGRVSGMHKEMLEIGGEALVISSDIKTDNYYLLSFQNSRLFKTWKDATFELRS